MYILLMYVFVEKTYVPAISLAGVMAAEWLKALG
jgi:hypothetical protein